MTRGIAFRPEWFDNDESKGLKYMADYLPTKRLARFNTKQMKDTWLMQGNLAGIDQIMRLHFFLSTDLMKLWVGTRTHTQWYQSLNGRNEPIFNNTRNRPGQTAPSRFQCVDFQYKKQIFRGNST